MVTPFFCSNEVFGFLRVLLLGLLVTTTGGGAVLGCILGGALLERFLVVTILDPYLPILVTQGRTEHKVCQNPFSRNHLT